MRHWHLFEGGTDNPQKQISWSLEAIDGGTQRCDAAPEEGGERRNHTHHQPAQEGIVEAFASVLLLPRQKLSIPRLTLAAERCMPAVRADLKQLEIRSAEQRVVIFKNSVLIRMLDVHHQTREQEPFANSIAQTRDACMQW